MGLLRIAAGLIAAGVLSIGTALAEPVTVTFVHFNDLDRMSADKGRGGVAKLATVVDQARAAGGTVIVTNGGDTISPSLLSSFDQGAHMIDLLNQVGLTAMVLGNHEFDFGPEVAEERIAQAEFPMLSSNAVRPDGSLLKGVTGRLMIEAGGYKIGMFGLTTKGTAEKSQPGNVEFADTVETARTMAAKLGEEGASVVVALAHTDLDEDTELLASGAVDLILSGDDHLLQVLELGDSMLIESGGQAEYITLIHLTLDTVEGRRGPKLVKTYNLEVINTQNTAEEPGIAKAVAAYEEKLSAELDIEIGTSATALDTRRVSVRSGENAFANMLVDAMREATGADIAITNGGGIRADRTYEPGTVLSRRDILSELPFGNKTVLIEVSGADVIAALENGVSGVEKGSGRFPHVSGLTFTFDPAKPAGSRVAGTTVAGKAIDPDGRYTLATNDFMGRGGDGYRMFAMARRIIDANAGALMASQLIQAIEQAGEVSPVVEGRITEAGK